MRKFVTSAFLAMGLSGIANADELWSCPDAETARKGIISGDIKNWSYFTPGPGLRVQLQHPKTALMAQAKFVGNNGKTGAICQYYSHIGLVATIYEVGMTRAKTKGLSYWREEYIESSPETDDPDKLMMDVCMMSKDGLAHMSAECPFNPPAD